MDERAVEELTAIVPPLLGALEALGFVARYLNPPDLAEVLGAVGEPEAKLAPVLAGLSDWPAELAHLRAAVLTAGEQVTAAFAGLREAAQTGEIGPIFRALRGLPRAQEALYPFAAGIGPVNRYFLEPGARADAALQARLADAPARDDTGVMHAGGEPGDRGGFSLYAPEYYEANRDWPLVVALHGGSGNGRAFLWTWLRDARSRGAILVSPTAIGQTWAISGADPDTPNLRRIVDAVRGRWRVDPKRILLTGLSDGGTFSYVSGLEPDSPFTHLAPVAAAFHPMLAQMADPDRLRGLPIHLAHGALDWMFPVDMARAARDALAAAGAAVTYRELPDLSHTYPRELNPQILAWMDETIRP